LIAHESAPPNASARNDHAPHGHSVARTASATEIILTEHAMQSAPLASQHWPAV